MAATRPEKAAPAAVGPAAGTKGQDDAFPCDSPSPVPNILPAEAQQVKGDGFRMPIAYEGIAKALGQPGPLRLDCHKHDDVLLVAKRLRSDRLLQSHGMPAVEAWLRMCPPGWAEPVMEQYRTLTEEDVVADGGIMSIGSEYRQAAAVHSDPADVMRGRGRRTPRPGHATVRAVGAGSEGGPAPRAGAGLGDRDLMERMRSSGRGGLLGRLLDGDASGHDGNRVAAAKELCRALDFWCAHDPTQMLRILESSGLVEDQAGAETMVLAATRPDGPAYEPSVAARRPAGGAPSAREGGWVVRGGELFKVVPTKEGVNQEFLVTSTAPWVEADVRDADTGEVRSLVRLDNVDDGGGALVPRDRLLSRTGVVSELAPLGANVSTGNACDVVSYLTAVDARGGRPVVTGASRAGWLSFPGQFLPYGASGEPCGARFDPPGDMGGVAAALGSRSGTLGDWADEMLRLSGETPDLAAALAASFASALVGPVGEQPFVLAMWGPSGHGKTALLKAAASVWGDPDPSAGYLCNFGDTPKSLPHVAAFLHDAPLCVDEFQAAPGRGQDGKREAVQQLLYAMTLGRERQGLHADRTLIRPGSFSCVTIATGEVPVVGPSTQQGAASRVLELRVEPFSERSQAVALHRFVLGHHGVAGPAFARAASGLGRDGLRTMRDDLESALGGGHAGDPHLRQAALCATAWEVALGSVFGVDDEVTRREAALAVGHDILSRCTGTEAGDTDLHGIQFLWDLLVGHVGNFVDGEDVPEHVELWGCLHRRVGEDGEPVVSDFCVNTQIVRRELGRAGYDERRVMIRMHGEGLLLTGRDRKRLTRKVRFQRGVPPTWAYCVMAERTERFLGGDEGE